MGVLWFSIGASPAYEIFIGLAEVGGGLLLFLPATAQLGAMMGLMNSIAIFTLNMTYDVPVKLFSFHLVLMSLVPRGAQRAPRCSTCSSCIAVTAIRPEPPLGGTPRARRNVVIAQVVFGLYALRARRSTAPVSRGRSSAAARRSRRSTASGTSSR